VLRQELTVGDAAELISDFCGDSKWGDHKGRPLLEVKEMALIASSKVETIYICVYNTRSSMYALYICRHT